ncbi:MAG: TonB family protein [Terriglobales bacterium]|jgi:TonB family protein
MFPQPMSRSEFRPDDSHLDLSRLLEQHLLAGFPSDLALDLILNELVARAAEATRASAAALALARGDEMVCRAATGHLAPDLGVPLNPRDGLSGACLQTRQPQLSVDTELDPRVDPAISRRRGIRSILIVPVFDSNDKNAQFTGVLEVFSTSPAAFSNSDQKLLEGFAEECTRVRHAAIELSQRKPAATLIPPDFIAAGPLPARRPPYEAWTLVLGSLTILATIAVSFLIGSRIGWLRPPQTASSSQITQPIQAETSKPQAPAKSCVGTAAPGCPAERSSTATAAAHRTNPSSSEKASAKASKQTSSTPAAAPAADELVVYEKGKVIFRMKPTPTKPDQAKPDLAKHPQAKPDSTKQASDSIVASSTTRIAPAKIATTKIAPLQGVRLSPEKAETRLLSRTEPQYPPEALAAHRSGNVVLEVHVAEDGSVSNIRTLSGDPLLAAAATEAVRNWRYEPYRLHDHPAQFQTDVTLSFSLPN